MTEDEVINDALRQADALFEDKIREAMTKAFTFGGEAAEADLEVIDDEIARCRREWAETRATIPGIIRRALATREAARHPS